MKTPHEFNLRSPAVAEDGFLYPNYRLPEYQSTEPALVAPGQPVKQDHYGTTYLDTWSMNDELGTHNKVMLCLAANPKTDVWVVKDTAWGTQPEGLNTDVARKLMSMGFNVVVKGPEIGSSIRQSRSAFNTHLILSALEQKGALSADRIAIEGYSRGSMIAFGTNAYAPQFGRQVLYSNLTDPCVARPVQADLATVKKALALPIDAALLGLAALQTLENPKRAVSLADTVDFSQEGFRQFVRTGRGLMNGEAGAMSERTPIDMHATIAFFRRCRMNDGDLFRLLLRNHGGVRFVAPEGGHGGGVDARIIGNVAVRFSRLAEQLREERHPSELDYSYILNGTQQAA